MRDELGGGERDKRFQENLKKPKSQDREVFLRINLRRRARGEFRWAMRQEHRRSQLR